MVNSSLDDMKKRLTLFLLLMASLSLQARSHQPSTHTFTTGDKPDLNSSTPAAKGQLPSGNGWQTIRFATPQKGRYLAIQCLSTHDGNPQAAIAEIYLQGTDGKRLSREPWTTKYADSENEDGNHTGDKVFDLQESTYWQTERSAAMPHLLVIDLGSEQTVSALEYLPRAEQGAPGSIKDYAIYFY